MIKVFKDGSKCIVDERSGLMKVNHEVINLRLGSKLNFIDGIRLVDGTFIQNMQFEANAEIPTPGEIAEALSQFGSSCEYFDSSSKRQMKHVKDGVYVLTPEYKNKTIQTDIITIKDESFESELAISLTEDKVTLYLNAEDMQNIDNIKEDILTKL